MVTIDQNSPRNLCFVCNKQSEDSDVEDACKCTIKRTGSANNIAENIPKTSRLSRNFSFRRKRKLVKGNSSPDNSSLSSFDLKSPSKTGSAVSFTSDKFYIGDKEINASNADKFSDSLSNFRKNKALAFISQPMAPEDGKELTETSSNSSPKNSPFSLPKRSLSILRKSSAHLRVSSASRLSPNLFFRNSKRSSSSSRGDENSANFDDKCMSRSFNEKTSQELSGTTPAYQNIFNEENVNLNSSPDKSGIFRPQDCNSLPSSPLHSYIKVFI